MIDMKTIATLFCWSLTLLMVTATAADEHLAQPGISPAITSTRSVPGKTWMRYATPRDAGWSAKELEAAHQYSNKIGSAAVMIIHDGIVVAAWGDITRRYMCHSIRKSFMSALYGTDVPSGNIDLKKTLDDLNVDDQPPLTVLEKQARVVDLLSARSGVYHSAAYETLKMKNQRPKRGSHKPGEFFWYNNWDFNALCTIFAQETGRRVFEAFQSRFAEPLEMEDFRLQDTYYHLELQHSIHPAYAFRMSARDMGRFGLLFLRNGQWHERQILSEAWIQESTVSQFEHSDREHSDRVPNPRYAYGYLWWQSLREPFKGLGMYSARGYGGHAIDILPGADLVVVHRVNTFWDLSPEFAGTQRARVSESERFGLLQRILDARIGDPNPTLVPLAPQVGTFRPIELAQQTLNGYVGDYRSGKAVLSILRSDQGLLLSGPTIGRFSLLPKSKTAFVLEDVGTPVTFAVDDHDQPIRFLLDSAHPKEYCRQIMATKL